VTVAGKFMVNAMPPDTAAEMLLRYQDASRRYYGNRTGQTLEEVVVDASRPFRLISEQLMPLALAIIDNYIRHHGSGACRPYCYCGN